MIEISISTLSAADAITVAGLVGIAFPLWLGLRIRTRIENLGVGAGALLFCAGNVAALTLLARTFLIAIQISKQHVASMSEMCIMIAGLYTAIFMVIAVSRVKSPF